MKTFNNYETALAHAQDIANISGLTLGIEKIREFGTLLYCVRFIPKAVENRFGCDATCEAVLPMVDASGAIC